MMLTFSLEYSKTVHTMDNAVHNCRISLFKRKDKSGNASRAALLINSFKKRSYSFLTAALADIACRQLLRCFVLSAASKAYQLQLLRPQAQLHRLLFLQAIRPVPFFSSERRLNDCTIIRLRKAYVCRVHVIKTVPAYFCHIIA